MRGHFGKFEQATCAVCTDRFTKKQPTQKYCNPLCYERRFAAGAYKAPARRVEATR